MAKASGRCELRRLLALVERQSEDARPARGRRFADVLETGGGMRLRDLFHRQRELSETAMTPRLVADDDDPGTVSDGREALVLVHGHYWKDGVGHDFDPAERAFLYEPFRADPRYEELRRRYRVYTYLYPSHADYAYSSTALAEALERLPSHGPHPDVTVVAHSMGGLVARYAMQKGRAGERLRKLITLATPHHGTILASIIMSAGPLHRKVGWVGHGIQRLGRRVWTPSRGMAGMAHDNFDGRIDEVEENQLGLLVNRQLAELNATDPYLDRTVCVMGRVKGWWLKGRSVWDQLPRWFMTPIDPIFSGLDPLVHLESGIADGLPVRSRHVLDDLDHQSIVTDSRTHGLLYEMLLEPSSAEAEEEAAA